MSGETPIVCVVDHDAEQRERLTATIGGMGLKVEMYASGEEFLDRYHDRSEAPKCMVLDADMPGLSGLGLQKMLAAEGIDMPVIMLSSSADIPTAVSAMRAGAMDFLEKPVDNHTLSLRIREAIDRCVSQQREAGRKCELAKRTECLSARQREVLELLVTGERSKQIARQLGIGEKTVAKHRATVLEKMRVDSVVELVCLFASASPTPQIGHASLAQCN